MIVPACFLSHQGGDAKLEPIIFDVRLHPLRIKIINLTSYRVTYRDHQGQLSPALEL